MKNEQARNEWQSVGMDALRIAKDWVRRYCALYGWRNDEDITADVIGTAYHRYCNWRMKNVPKDVFKVITSRIRDAARGAVLDDIGRYHPEEISPTTTAKPDSDVARLVRVLSSLPDKLAELAATIAMAREMPTERDLAERCGITRDAVMWRMKLLKSHPAMQDLFLADVIESATAGL